MQPVSPLDPPHQRQNTCACADERLTKIETSICELIVQMKHIFKIANNESKPQSCNCKTVDNDSTNTAKAIEKKLDQLTDSMNRKFSELNKKLPSYADVTKRSEQSTVASSQADSPNTRLVSGPIGSPGPHGSTMNELGSGAVGGVPAYSNTRQRVEEDDSQEADIGHQPQSAGQSDIASAEVSEGIQEDSDPIAIQPSQPPSAPTSGLQLPEIQQGSPAEPHQSPSPRALTRAPDVMLIGDSNVRHIRERWLIPGKRTVKVELRNKTLIGARNFIQNMKTKPNRLIIQCGKNDADNNNTNSVIQDMKRVLDTATDVLPNCQISISTVFHTTIPQYKMEQLDERLKNLCQQYGAMYISLVNICSNENDFDDDKHLNKTGLSQLVRLYKSVLYPNFGLEYSPQTTVVGNRRQLQSSQRNQRPNQLSRHNRQSYRYDNDNNPNTQELYFTKNRFAPIAPVTVHETMV